MTRYPIGVCQCIYTLLLFWVCSHDLKASDKIKLYLNGNAVQASFDSPLPTADGSTRFGPAHSYDNGQYFEFGLKSASKPVYARVRIEKTGATDVGSDRVLQSELTKLKESYKNPKGKIVAVTQYEGRPIPIMSFTNVAGDFTTASLPDVRGYRVTISLQRDMSFDDLRLAGYTKTIVDTFRVNVTRGDSGRPPRNEAFAYDLVPIRKGSGSR